MRRLASGSMYLIKRDREDPALVEPQLDRPRLIDPDTEIAPVSGWRIRSIEDVANAGGDDLERHVVSRCRTPHIVPFYTSFRATLAPTVGAASGRTCT